MPTLAKINCLKESINSDTENEIENTPTGKIGGVIQIAIRPETNTAQEEKEIKYENAKNAKKNLQQ